MLLREKKEKTKHEKILKLEKKEQFLAFEPLPPLKNGLEGDLLHVCLHR